MKKFLSILLVMLLLCNLFTGITIVAEESSFKGTACQLNQDGSVTVSGNGYYTQTAFTNFSNGEEATITVTLDEVGNDWASNGFALIVNSELSASLPHDAWHAEGRNGIFAFTYYLNTAADNSKQLLSQKYVWGQGQYDSRWAGWEQPSFAEGAPLTVTFTVKKVGDVVTIIRNGKTWNFNNSGSYNSITLPDGYLGIATAPNAKVTVHASQGVAYGTNYLSKQTYEDGDKGFWTNTYGVGVHSIVEGGYKSEHALHSAMNGKTGLNRLISSPIAIGNGFGQVPVDTWCTWSFKVRTTAGTEAGLLAHADVKTSENQSIGFDLSPLSRTPLNGDKWVEMSMRFKITVNADNQAVIEIRRYDWSYLLSTTPRQLTDGETFTTLTLVAQSSDIDLWFDDVFLYYEKENDMIQPSLSATPSKVAVGEEFTVNYTLNNNSNYAIKDVPYTLEYNPLMVKPITSVSGKMDLAANASQTVSVTFKVLEGGAAVITAGGAAGIQEAAVRVSCTGRGYYFGDSHSHSTESDGKNTPYENLKQFYKLGMSYNISADHNANVGDAALLERWDDALAQVRSEISNPDRFLNIVANENSKDWNHLLQYFGTKQYYTPYTIAGMQEVIAGNKADGGLNFIAHPFLETTGQFWPILKGPSVIIPELREVNGIEIINSQTLDQTYETVPKALEWWDRYNITGWNRYVGIGNSDGHKVHELVGSYNALLLDELTEENIKNAYINGNLYFTTGPQLRYTLDGADMGGNAVVSGKNEKVSLHVTAYTPNGNPIEKVVVYRYSIGSDIDALYQEGQDNAIVLYERAQDKEDLSLFTYDGELEVSPDQFVRVEVYAAQDQKMVIGNYQMAMSNPIWVVDENEKTLDHIEISQDATKQVYGKGEALDVSGMKVTAVYTDGSESEVTDYTVSPSVGQTLVEPGKHTIMVSYTHAGVTAVTTFAVTVEHRDGETYRGTNCTEDITTGNVSVQGGYYTQTAFTNFSQGEEATITIAIDKFGNDRYDKNIWFNNGFAVIVNPELSDSIPDSSLWDSAIWNTEPLNFFAYCFENHKTDGLRGSRCYPGNGTFSLSYVDGIQRKFIGDDTNVTIRIRKVDDRTVISFNGYDWDSHNTVTIPDGYLGLWVSENAKVTVTNSTSTGVAKAPIQNDGAGILDTLVNDKQGLRFNYTLTTTLKNGVETVALNGKTYTIDKIGMLVSKKADADMVVGGTGVMNAYVTSARKITKSGDKITYNFSILVKNVGKTNKQTDIYARPYLLCDDGTILYGTEQVTNVYEMYQSLSQTHDFDAAIDAWMKAGLMNPDDSDDPYDNDDNWADGKIPPRK